MNLDKKKRRKRQSSTIPTVKIQQDLNAFLHFMSDDYRIDFQTALNTAIRIGMHQILAKYFCDKELSLLK